MSKIDWKSSASISLLKQRAELLKTIRQFFSRKKVLEVETPLLAQHTIPDANIPSIEAYYHPDLQQTAKKCYLQTSPEFAMKRLLASGSGSIYQICKAFRNDYCGRLHNPEFTMLEWYQVGFDMQQLIAEVDELLQLILKCNAAKKMSYQNFFLEYVDVDPLAASVAELKVCAKNFDINLSDSLSGGDDKDQWLNLIMSHCIEPKLGKEQPVIVYNYPASQAALAKVDSNDRQVANRFEAFYQGLEIANGFCELSDSSEQRERFEKYQQQSQEQKMPVYDLDEEFLTSLDFMPDCSGVAVGLDRLLMLISGEKSISKVLAFPFLFLK